MSKLFLTFVRHGEYQQKAKTPSASQPFELTEHGKIQSRQSAQQIYAFVEQHQLKVKSAIFSSNLLRAWQTAKIIRDELKDNHHACHIESTAQLNERSVGAVANLSIEEIEAVLETDPRFERPSFDWKSDTYYCLPFDGAESLMQSGERVANFIRKTFVEVKQMSSKDTLVIMVGHGASFRHAAHLLGVLEFDEIAKYSMYHSDPIFFEMTPCLNLHTQCFKKVAGDWKIRKNPCDSQTLEHLD